MKRMISAVLSASLASGCISTYKGHPKKALDIRHEPGRFDTLHYGFAKYKAGIHFGGVNALKDYLREGPTPFRSTIKADAPPEKGFFVRIDLKWKTPTIGALVWGYIAAIGFLLALPAFSNHDGYEIDYTLYRDGNVVETYSYDITRKTGAWLVFLPFIWVNLLTPSEKDAFTATAKDFFERAQPVFEGKAP